MLYIILPVHNRKKITERIIDCFLNQTYEDYHLLLIDDGSTDGTSEMVKERIRSLTILQGKGNWWWAGSLHQGYKWIKKNAHNGDDFVLIINDDTEFDKNFFQTALKILENNQNTLLLAQDFNRENNELLDTGSHVDWKNFTFFNAKNPEEINILSTRGLFLRVKDFKKVGGFHPILIPHYQSDYEFTHRAFRKGFKLITHPELKLFEDTKQTGIRKEIKGFKGFFQTYFSKRSNSYHLSWIFFILFSCPWKWKLRNLYKISFTKKVIEFLKSHYYQFLLVIKYFNNKIVYYNISPHFSGIENKIDFELYNVEKDIPNPIIGHLDIKQKHNIIKKILCFYFKGWARDPKNSQKPAKKVLILKNDIIVGEVPNSNKKREDVAIHFNINELKYCGWEVFIPFSKGDNNIEDYSFYSLSWDNKTIYKI